MDLGVTVKEANYGSEVDITSGPFEFSLSHTENDQEGEHGEGHPDDEGNSHHQPDFVSLPVDEVKSFVDAFVQSREDLLGSRPIWAEKFVDAIKGEERFVFNVGLDRGFSLIFDQNESFLHALPSDEFAHSEREFIDLDQLPQEISDAISEDVYSYSILDAEKEFSILQSDEPSYVYNVFFEQNGTKYVAHLTAGFNLILIEMDDRGDFEDEWRPVELPAVARDYLEENFADLIGEGTNLFVEERPTPEGEGKEIVAFLDDGTELIFDTEGVFLR